MVRALLGLFLFVASLIPLALRAQSALGWRPRDAWVTAGAGLALVAAMLYAVRGGPRARQRRRLGGLTWRELDRLDGPAFESWCHARLRRGGFRVARTPATRDFGVDLIVRTRGGGVAIEVKSGRGPIGNDVVRSVLGGSDYHGCRAAVIIARTAFTPCAGQQAARGSLPVLLLGRDALPHLPRALRRWLRALAASRE